MFKDINNLQLITWGLILLLFVWLLLVSVRLRRIARNRRLLDESLQQDGDISNVISRALEKIDVLEKEHTVINKTIRKHRRMLGETTRCIGLVRYDAFEGVGGKLSFSAALLDEKGNGLVITSINGRSETRVYAKPVADRLSVYPLSEEENEAIKQALDKLSTRKVIKLESSR